jgi:HEAT repeat protein
VRKVLWRAAEDSSPLVRSYVAAAIGQIGTEVDRVRLYNWLRKTRSETVRIGILVALFSLGDRSPVEELIAMLRSRSYRIRCAAANNLAGLSLNDSEKKLVLKNFSQALKNEKSFAVIDTLRRNISSLRRPVLA